MARALSLETRDFCQEMVRAYAINDRMNQLVLEHLDPQAWRAKAPGRSVRTIAGIFSHMHNIRRKWLRLSAPHVKLPKELDRGRCTPRQASQALAGSAHCCVKLLTEALDPGNAQVRKFHRDGWARPWSTGPAMFAYMIVHDAHHRGQICMLAHQLGFPLPTKVTSEMWMWEKLWRESGFGQLQVAD